MTKSDYCKVKWPHGAKVKYELDEQEISIVDDMLNGTFDTDEKYCGSKGLTKRDLNLLLYALQDKKVIVLVPVLSWEKGAAKGSVGTFAQQITFDDNFLKFVQR